MTKDWGNPAYIFGTSAPIHPITRRYLEQGRGALPVAEQVEQQLQAIEREDGKEVADEMRRRLEVRRDHQI